MNNVLEDLKNQHNDNYKKAILEIIKNNTNILVNEDMMSLFKAPPLDSMDVIKNKFLDIAKKFKIVLNIDILHKMIDDYRLDVISVLPEIMSYRIAILKDVIQSGGNDSNNIVVKVNKKDFINLNKHNKKVIKNKIVDAIQNKIVNNVNKLFTKETDELVIEKFSLEINKYLSKVYLKQIIENIDFKILVKDTILINSIKEQGERYLFTMQNSRIFNE